MSYLSLITDLEKRIKKEGQLASLNSHGLELFKGLNLKSQTVLLQKEIDDRLSKLPYDRRAIYEKLYAEFNQSIKIINAKDLIPNLNIPNGNEIEVISLVDNELGENHYAGVYLDLILENEANGNIIPGKTKLFETSSGSGGIACSKVAKELGYPCLIAMPAGGEKSRESAVIDNGAELDTSVSAEEYTNGFPSFISSFYRKNVKAFRDKELFFLSHSQGKKTEAGNYENNQTAIKALAKTGYKILGCFKDNSINADYVVSGIGNGTNTLGIGGLFHLHGVKIVGFETFEGANMYEKIYPGEYEKVYGIKPGDLGRHSMPGLSPSNNKIPFPHFDNSIDMVSDVYLVANEKLGDKYYQSTGKKLNDKNIVYFDQELYQELSDRGRTSKAGFYVAMELAKKVTNNKIVVFRYDNANRYDS